MKKLFGFTLSEVLVTLTIIGIIIIFYIPVNKVISVQYTTLAYSALESLSLASKELMSGDIHVKQDSTTLYALADQNGEMVITPNTHSFCMCFANVLNIRGGANCPNNESSYSSVSGSDPLKFKLSSKNWDEPNVIGTNGYKYYISAHKDQNNSVASRYGYRVIAMDITGKKKPNAEDSYPDSQSGQPADIIYFIMLDDGSVFPIGVAATNRNYINSRTIAYYFSSENVPSDLLERKASGCRSFVTSEGVSNFKDLVWSAPTGSSAPSTLLECNFWKDSLMNPDPDTDNPMTYSYRMAYCLQKGQTGHFKGYNCTGTFSQASVCATGGNADECILEPIKPLYKVKI